MTLESIITVSIATITLVTAPFLYIWKNAVSRIEKLEEEVDSKMSETEVRQLLADKLEPISRDTREVKELVIQLLQLELRRKR